MSVQADRATPMERSRERLTRSVDVDLSYDAVSEGLLEDLLGLCRQHQGSCDLVVHLRGAPPGPGGRDAVVRSRSIRVQPTDDLLQAMGSLAGLERARIIPRPLQAGMRA